MKQEYYKALGVGRSASAKQIRDAYRRLARRYHPDINPGDSSSEKKFKNINESYEVLSDPKKRADYDQFGKNWRHAEQIRKSQNTGDGRFISGGFNHDSESHFGNVDELLNRFGFGHRENRAHRSKSEQKVAINVSLEEAFSGTNRNITYKTNEPCVSCAPYSSGTTSGCAFCFGNGYVETSTRIEVKIPAGIDDGGKIRIRPHPNVAISILVRLKTHKQFSRKGTDLHTEIWLPFTDAILGGEVEVPTLTGRIVLTIPAGTENGKTFSLLGKGMPKMNRDTYGTLYAKVQATLPKTISCEERELFKKLKEIREKATE